MSNTSAMSNAATSPLECLPIAELTPSGLLLLDSSDGEVELAQRHGNLLQLRSEAVEPLSTHAQYKDRVSLNNVVLTTHRIVMSNDEKKRFLHLSNIHAVESVSTSVFSQHCKVRISTYSLGELILVLPKKETLLPILEKTLERRAWESASRLQEAKAATATSKRRVGVDAILSSQQRKHERAAKITDQAFTGDAETLLREATELVSIIQKYASTLEQQNSSEDKQDKNAMADMLQDMGMASALPVSFDNSTIYYETLARQLADFLSPKLEQTSGIMTLTDVYCLYNRARGTNLISPQDLLTAVECMDKISTLNLKLKTFPSGLKVVLQANKYNEEELAKRLQEMCLAAEHQSLTSLDASRLLKMSAMLAQEALLAAERQGYLCRDTTLETTRFYSNRFPEFARMKW